MAFTFHPRVKWLMGALLLCFIAFIRPSDVFIYMHSPFQDGDKTQSVPGMINKGSGYAGEVLFVLWPTLSSPKMAVCLFHLFALVCHAVLDSGKLLAQAVGLFPCNFNLNMTGVRVQVFDRRMNVLLLMRQWHRCGWNRIHWIKNCSRSICWCQLWCPRWWNE